jgi:transposase
MTLWISYRTGKQKHWPHGDAVRAVVERQHAGVRRVASQIAEEAAAPGAGAPKPTPDKAKPTAAERRGQDAYARRQARYKEAARLKAAGLSPKRIAAAVGAERKTVWRWLRASGAPRWLKPRWAGALEPYYDHLDRRWKGCHNAALLWRELAALGFAGRPGSMRQWAGRRRKTEPDAASTSGTRAVAAQPPSARQIACLLMTDEALPEAEQDLVSRLLAQLPGLAGCIAAAKRLNALLRRKSRETLEKVLADAGDAALKEFVASLRRDLGAVQAALDLPWTTSPAEGQINRLKMLKRTMFGRASFALLRARVLHAS